MRAGIIGLGYVGLTLAIAAAAGGVDVYGVEINDHIKACIGENRAHFYEPGLDALIQRHNGERFHCVEKFPEDKPFDVFVITVGTPLERGRKTPNFEYVKSALGAIKGAYSGRELVILRSTVSVGTTQRVVRPFLAELCGKDPDKILIGMCPERTVEGKAVEELTHLPQIISGNSEAALELAQRFFRHMTPYVIPASSIEEAELVKLYCNTYRDMTFAIGNAFCMAAQTFGVDGLEVIRHANEGYARSNICMPGFVAGPCLEKDSYILTHNMLACESRDFILQGRHLNESLEDMVAAWVEEKAGGPGDGKTIALSGMAFKGQPETSDLRGSPSVYIAQKLKNMGYHLNLHDFAAFPAELEALDLGTVYETVYDACEDAVLLLVLNNHKGYFNLQEDSRIVKWKNGFSILDAWGVCTNLHHNKNIKIYTLGNIMIPSREAAVCGA